MHCYFLCDGHLAGVEMLPPGFSEGDAIARATFCPPDARARMTASSFGIADVRSLGILTRTSKR